MNNTEIIIEKQKELGYKAVKLQLLQNIYEGCSFKLSKLLKEEAGNYENFYGFKVTETGCYVLVRDFWDRYPITIELNNEQVEQTKEEFDAEFQKALEERIKATNFVDMVDEPNLPRKTCKPKVEWNCAAIHFDPDRF
jgi:hypothetical protein